MLTAIRVPRVLATALVGAAWAVAGVAMQGLYRMEALGQHPDMGPILVTGATGGVGSFAIDIFTAAGYEVLTYDNLSTGHREGVLHGELVVGDLADRAKSMASLTFDDNTFQDPTRRAPLVLGRADPATAPLNKESLTWHDLMTTD